MPVSPEPSDNTTLSSVIADYASGGYAEQFSVTDEGVRCAVCGTTSDPGEVELRSLRRLEGASDPADMAAVLALVCPACGAKGTTVVMFGPEASACEAELLQRVRDHRLGDDDLPAGAGPHEGTPGADPPPTNPP